MAKKQPIQVSQAILEKEALEEALANIPDIDLSDTDPNSIPEAVQAYFRRNAHLYIRNINGMALSQAVPYGIRMQANKMILDTILAPTPQKDLLAEFMNDLNEPVEIEESIEVEGSV